MQRSPLALILAAALVSGGPLSAEMTDAERAEFRAEVRAYLLENPELLSEMFAILESRQALASAEADRALVAANAAAIFEDGHSFVGGNPEGGVTLVEFVDYQCGYCRRAHPEVMALVAADGDIRRIVKEYPILGPGSELAARAAIATLIAEGPERYADLNGRLMKREGPVTDAGLDAILASAGLDPAAVRAGMNAAEVSRRLEANLALGHLLDIQGTPTFAIGSRLLRGYVPLAGMRDLVAAIRAEN